MCHVKIVKQKVSVEETIHTALQDMVDRLPEMKIYERIYPDLALSSLLAHVYCDVILFFRESISYLLGSSLSMLKLSGSSSSLSTPKGPYTRSIAIFPTKFAR